MSDLDIKALQTNFGNWHKERASNLPDWKAFERYCVEQIMKESDLSDEEAEYGDIGGGDDGGIDAFYLLINRTLITEETIPADPALSVELVIIQAKNESGYTEVTVQKMQSFTEDLLNYSKNPDQISYLNSKARDSIKLFRTKYDTVLGSPHSLTISFHYATRSDVVPTSNDKVSKRVDNLKSLVRSRMSAADVQFTFWGCEKLLRSVRSVPKQDEVLEITNHFSTDDGSVVCLIRLREFARFLTDEHKNMKTRILEPNVRDYQGPKNSVNTDIRTTLEEPRPGEEFWWLNNGVTILASACSITENKLKVTTPEIVNGLQTSHEIFKTCSGKEGSDTRTLLVRVILPTDEKIRNRVIKATNFQSPVDAVSLRVTDRIHFDVEDRLRLYGLFYDRRKGEYRRRRKPISAIVSIRGLAQSVMAVLLRQPDDARARPQSLLKDDNSYMDLFSESYNRDVYATCILIDRQVEAMLDADTNLTKDEKRNIRYYADMLIGCEITQQAEPTAEELAKCVMKCSQELEEDLLVFARSESLRIYKLLGATDTVAKGPTMRDTIRDFAKQRYQARETPWPSSLVRGAAAN